MAKVKIVTDSTGDLTEEIIREHDIRVVPLYVRFGEEVFADGVEIDSNLLFQKVRETDLMPQTAAPTPDDFQQVFKELIDNDQDIICICLSSHLSATVQSATLAAAEFPQDRIQIIDGLNLSMGTGLLALYAAELAATGQDLTTIVTKVKERIPNTKSYFVVDTMEYLYKGGRCSAIQNLMAGVLKIHPVLTVEDGKIIVKDKIRGGEKKMLDRLVDYLVSQKDGLDAKYMAVAGAACPQMVKALHQRVKEEFPAARVIEAEAGSVIASHCGPGTFGMFYVS